MSFADALLFAKGVGLLVALAVACIMAIITA